MDRLGDHIWQQRLRRAIMERMKAIALLPTRERFLRFRPATMLEHVLRDPRLSAQERAGLETLAEMVALRFHWEFHRKAEELKRLYDPFDPDLDTLPAAQLSQAELDRRRSELCASVRKLLLEGNYVELPRRQILECVELQNYGGLKVEADLDDYKDLAIFYRGAERQQRCGRSWRRAWRKQAKSCTMFSRAAVLVRTAEEENRVYLKLFKDIVAEDLEMVLPQVRIRMHWVDGLKIGSGVAGSLATAAWKAFTAALLSPWLFLIVLATFLAAIVRALVAYITSKTRYMQALSANLYFQNLANNASVLTCLVDAAEAEEAKELLLAYFLLYVERDREYTVEELGRRAGEWVRDKFGLEIDFEARDAVRKLIDKGLAVERAASGDGRSSSETGAPGAQPAPCRRVLKVYDLPSALRRLDKAWDDFYRHHDRQTAEADRLADEVGPPAQPPPGPHWPQHKRAVT